MPNPYITSKTFAFFAELAANNDRDWFQDNKRRYHDDVRDPLLQFISDVGPHLQKISKNMTADPRPNGGSLFRIHRDTRFSKDKTPYKTNAAMIFRHADGKNELPGFYLQVEPGNVFLGGGLWHAETGALKAIRDAIVASPARWKKVANHRAFDLDDGDDTLKRPPRGYDPEHPFIEDLKRKSFTTSRTYTQKQAMAGDFMGQFVKGCRERAPLLAWLCGALGRPW